MNIEAILLQDPEAVRAQTLRPNEDVQRALSEGGKRQLAQYFYANYTPGPTLPIAASDVVDGFLEQFEGDIYSAFDSAAAALAGIVGTTDEWIKYRKKNALSVSFGQAQACPVSWLMDGIIPLGSVTMIVGAPNELKSWLAVTLAKSCAHGEEWLGRAPHWSLTAKKAQTMYIDFEMGAEELERRLALMGDTGGRVLRASNPTVRLSDEALWNALAEWEPDVVIIDTFSSGSGDDQNENDPRYAQPLARARAYAAEHGTTFIVLHHSPKAPASARLLDVVRGSGAIAGALDTCLYVKAVPCDDPRERRAVVRTLKQRRSGQEAAPFTVALTDAGLRVLGSKDEAEAPAKDMAPAAPQTDEDRLLAAVAANPGIGGRRALAAASGLSEVRAWSARKALIEAGRIEDQGEGKRPAHFVLTPLSAI